MPLLKFTTDKTVKRLRAIMLGTIVFDDLNTLFGQSSSYWQHPETVQEGNHLTHYFISRGPACFCLYELVYMAAIYLVVSLLPRQCALVTRPLLRRVHLARPPLAPRHHRHRPLRHRPRRDSGLERVPLPG